MLNFSYLTGGTDKGEVQGSETALKGFGPDMRYAAPGDVTSAHAYLLNSSNKPTC